MQYREKVCQKHAPKARAGIFSSSALPLCVPAGVGIIVVVIFLAYFPSLNGGFLFDDELVLTKNPFIKASDGLYRFWCTAETQDYWPVTYTSFWIEWRLWGKNPIGYHVTNLLLHIIETLLIWVILRKMSIPGAFLAAMLFAVHPVNVESVAWITQRKNTMAMLFFLLSIFWYLKGFASSGSENDRCNRNNPGTEPARGACGVLGGRWYWMSLAAFVLAMLSKGSVAILPVLLLGIIWWMREKNGTGALLDQGLLKKKGTGTTLPEKKGTGATLRSEPVPFFSGGDLVRIAPFFIVAVVLTGVNVWFQTLRSGQVYWTAGFLERLLGAGSVVWFYLYKALLPIDLAFVYPQWHIEAGNPLWWLPLFAALAVTAVVWLYRGSWSRPLLLAWGFFCVALIPVMGFADIGFMIYSLVADHYQHIALIGVVTLAAAGWGIWHKHAQGRPRLIVFTVALIAAGALALLTWEQSRLYGTPMRLYQVTLEKNPDCWMAHGNLGKELFAVGRVQEAIEHYDRALALKADYPEAHCNLGAALVQIGRIQDAIEHFHRAMELKPNYPEIYYNLAGTLLQTGNLEAAIELYGQALRLRPDYHEAHNNLGTALVRAGRLEEAIAYYEEALALKPDYHEAHNNLGAALVQAGRLEEAIAHYEQALKIKPDYLSAHYNLGNTLLDTGRLPEAIEHYKQVLAVKPDFSQAYYNLALALAGMRQSSEAIAAAKKALDLAKSQGQTELAKQIEDWLNVYRASLSD